MKLMGLYLDFILKLHVFLFIDCYMCVLLIGLKLMVNPSKADGLHLQRLRMDHLVEDFELPSSSTARYMAGHGGSVGALCCVSSSPAANAGFMPR